MSHADTIRSDRLVLLRSGEWSKTFEDQLPAPIWPSEKFSLAKKTSYLLGCDNRCNLVHGPVTARGRAYEIDDHDCRNINAKFFMK